MNGSLGYFSIMTKYILHQREASSVNNMASAIKCKWKPNGINDIGTIQNWKIFWGKEKFPFHPYVSGKIRSWPLSTPGWPSNSMGLALLNPSLKLGENESMNKQKYKDYYHLFIWFLRMDPCYILNHFPPGAPILGHSSDFLFWNWEVWGNKLCNLP